MPRAELYWRYFRSSTFALGHLFLVIFRLSVLLFLASRKMRPLSPSSDMAIELVRIWITQQHPTLMTILFLGELVKKRPYDLPTSMSTAFGNLKHNTTLAIHGDDFASASQALSSGWSTSQYGLQFHLRTLGETPRLLSGR